MLDLDPKKRPSVYKILKMDFIKKQKKFGNFGKEKREQTPSKYKTKLNQFYLQKDKIKSAKVSIKQIQNPKQNLNSFRVSQNSDFYQNPKKKRFPSKTPEKKIRQKAKTGNLRGEHYIKNRREKIKRLKNEARKIQKNQEHFHKSHRMKPPTPGGLKYFTKKSVERSLSRSRNNSEKFQRPLYKKKRGYRKFRELGFQSKSTKVQRNRTPEPLSNYMDMYHNKFGDNSEEKKRFFFFQKKMKDDIF